MAFKTSSSSMGAAALVEPGASLARCQSVAALKIRNPCSRSTGVAAGSKSSASSHRRLCKAFSRGPGSAEAGAKEAEGLSDRATARVSRVCVWSQCWREGKSGKRVVRVNKGDDNAIGRGRRQIRWIFLFASVPPRKELLLSACPAVEWRFGLDSCRVVEKARH